MEPYRRRNGETHGDEAPAAAARPRRRADLATRARLARRRARDDPGWRMRSPESRRLLIDLDAEEERP